MGVSDPLVGPQQAERFWRSPHRAPLAVGIGVAIAALLSQWLLPHAAATVITSTLFTRETWLHDDSWNAAFLFLTVAWWFGARATGHRAYRVLPIAVLWVGSYILRAATFIGLLMAQTAAPLSERGRAQATDVVALAFVCLGAYAWMRSTLRKSGDEARSGAATARRGFALGLLATVFALATLAKATPCSTMDCRAEALRTGVGDEVMRFVDTYVRTSPAIVQDIGAIEGVGLRSGTRSRVEVWMDYGAELFLEVRGARGSGTLDLSLAGNSYRDLSNSVGWWHVSGRRVPLDNKGAIDTIRLRAETTRAQETELEAARAKSDCAAVLAVIARNDDADRSQTAFRFEQRDVSLWRAECAEKVGDPRQAADAYVAHALRLRPMPFSAEPGDAAKARSAQDFLAKAVALDPQSPRRSWWEIHLKVLRVQERFAQTPQDRTLCLELKQALAEGRVHYTNACT